MYTFIFALVFVGIVAWILLFTKSPTDPKSDTAETDQKSKNPDQTWPFTEKTVEGKIDSAIGEVVSTAKTVETAVETAVVEEVKTAVRKTRKKKST